MGERIGYVCKNCGEEINIDTGFGMLSLPEFLLEKKGEYNLLKVCKNKNMGNFTQLKEFFEKDNLEIKNYGYCPYICENCKEITSNFNFNLSCKGENLTFKPKYYCDKCKKELRTLSEDEIRNLRCPKCGSDELLEGIHIDWD